MKKLFCIMFFFVLPMPAFSQAALAVLPLSGADSLQTTNATGVRIAEYISAFMAQSAMIPIVERAQLAKVYSEISLGQSGAIDEKNAVQAGKMAGASRIIIGSFIRVSGGLRVNARIVNAETGVIEGSAIEEGQKEKAVLDAVSVKLLQCMGIAASYNKSYIRRRALGFGSGVAAVALAGCAIWSQVEFQSADTKYRTSYNLSADDYAKTADKAQFHQNGRFYFGGGAAILLGTAVAAFATNRTQWVFKKEANKASVAPFLSPLGPGCRLTLDF